MILTPLRDKVSRFEIKDVGNVQAREASLNISYIMIIGKPSTTTYIDKCEEYCAADERISKMKALMLVIQASSSSSKLSRRRTA